MSHKRQGLSFLSYMFHKKTDRKVLAHIWNIKEVETTKISNLNTLKVLNYEH